MINRIIGVMALAALTGVGVAQSVTVGTTGADHTTLKAALDAVRTNPAAPNVITFIDAGPFISTDRIIIDVWETGPDDLTIQGAPGVRPILIADLENTTWGRAGMLLVRKEGNMTIKDLILIPPATGVTPENRDLKVPETAIEMYVETDVVTSITLENILISANNGSNQPTAALDGLTPPVTTPGAVSFRDEGILVQSQVASTLNDAHYIYFKDVVVSGLNGDQGSDGIRGFVDGGPGSQWILGPGTVISYNAGHAFQPGGTTNFAVQLRGAQGDPVKLINNGLSGINVTNQAGATSGLTDVQWAIIANNTQNGVNNTDVDTGTTFTNVTIANNGGIALAGPGVPNAVTYSFSNVIAAGDGAAADADNVIRVKQTGTGTAVPSFFTAADSAIVLNGPYTLNNTAYGNDGIDSDANYTVTLTNVTNADPQFISLDPAAGGFAVVGNQAFATAGPAGGPLVGGGSIAGAGVEDWQLF